MGQPVLLELSGAVTLSPVGSGCAGGPSLSDVMQLSICAGYGASASGRVPVSADISSPDPIPLQGIVKVRFLSICSISGSPMKLVVSSPNGGANQVIPFTNFLIQCPGNGNEMTALSLVGNGDVSYLIAGDAG